MTRRRRVNVPLGLLCGLVAASLVSAVAVLVFLIGGPARFEASGISLGGVVTTYAFGGAVGGALLGLMLPLAAWRIGAVILGVTVALPFYLAAATMLGHEDVWSGVIAAVFVGGIVGYGLWSPVVEQGSPEA